MDSSKQHMKVSWNYTLADDRKNSSTMNILKALMSCTEVLQNVAISFVPLSREILDALISEHLL